METKFEETQKFTQWWLWLILLLILSLPIIELVGQIFFKFKITEKSLSSIGLMIVFLSLILLVIFFKKMTLKTTIDFNEIKVSFRPFTNFSIKWDDITKAEIINYGFVGYGLRFSRKFGTIYNTSGKYGLAIEKKNGEKMVIGTTKTEELQSFLDHLNLPIFN